MRTEACPRTASRNGFTLIEVGVTIAVFAVLAIVLAAGAQQEFIRTATLRVVACESRLAAQVNAMSMYAADNGGVFAGPNTSGADGQATGGHTLVGEHSFATPTEVHDWMSPTLFRYTGSTANRAERLARLLNNFGCPEATVQNDEVYAGSFASDLADFGAQAAFGGFRQVSYLSPASFHYFPNVDVANQNRYHVGSFTVLLKYNYPDPVSVNPAYRPRTDLVGTQPSNKVYTADGTRYLDDTGILDFDASPSPSALGNFLDLGPIYDGSTAYGRRSASNGAQLPLTFRHGNHDTLNAAFFDGSVRSMNQLQAWTDARPWYPGGSVFTGVGATPESQLFHQVGEVLP